MMEKVFSRALGAAAALIFAFSLTACSWDKAAHNVKYFDGFMGATVCVSITADASSPKKKERLNGCFDALKTELDRINAAFSSENPESTVSAYNGLASGETCAVDGEFEELFSLARRIYGETDGAYNPFVKRLVDLWGFSARYAEADYAPTEAFDRERLSGGGFPLPDERYISAFSRLSAFDAEIEDGIIKKNRPAEQVDGGVFVQQLDFSGIVKGYAADVLAQKIVSYGYKSFYVNVGSSSMYLSSDEGKPFELEVTDPFNPAGRGFCTVAAENVSVSTSGTYQNVYEIGGVKLHHVIDWRTGRPADTDILSVTLICGGSALGAEADALSTALIVMGAQKAAEFLSGRGMHFVIVTEEKTVITDLGEDLTLLDDSFTVTRV